MQHGVLAQVFADKTLYSDEYSSKGIITVKVINKYGNIKIRNWDKDSVKITTEINLYSTTQKKLQKLQKLIKTDYENDGNVIVAQTLFGDNKTMFIKEVQDFTRDLSPGTSKRIEVNYEIFLPKDVKLELNNEFGDIILGSLNNRLKVDLSSGSFTSADIENDVTLKFKFVNATMNDIKSGYMDVKYSTVNIHKADELNIESKSSEFYIDKAVLLKINLSRDKLFVGKLDFLYGTSGYSTVKVSLLNKELNSYFEYGEVTVSNMGKEVSLVDITSERTDIILYVPKDIAYKYNILYNENAWIFIPQKNVKPEYSEKIEDARILKGSAGKNPVFDIRINALKKCDIEIHEIENITNN